MKHSKLVAVSFALASSTVLAFAPLQSCPRQTTELSMAKRMWNKQAEMLKKLEVARKQKAAAAAGKDASSVTMEDDQGIEPDLSGLSDKEIRERNERLRFEQLLATKAVSTNDLSYDGYMAREQEEQDFSDNSDMVERLFEGDRAPVEPFESLILAGNEQPIGPEGTKKLIPWMRSTGDSGDYLVILSDPRMTSPEFRETIQTVKGQLSKDVQNRLIFINADSPPENRRWLKKNNLMGTELYSDEDRSWMRAYTALGETRLSMSMFVIANERIQRVTRELDGFSAVSVIESAVKSLPKRL